MTVIDCIQFSFIIYHFVDVHVHLIHVDWRLVLASRRILAMMELLRDYQSMMDSILLAFEVAMEIMLIKCYHYFQRVYFLISVKNLNYVCIQKVYAS